MLKWFKLPLGLGGVFGTLTLFTTQSTVVASVATVVGLYFGTEFALHVEGCPPLFSKGGCPPRQE